MQGRWRMRALEGIAGEANTTIENTLVFHSKRGALCLMSTGDHLPGTEGPVRHRIPTEIAVPAPFCSQPLRGSGGSHSHSTQSSCPHEHRFNPHSRSGHSGAGSNPTASNTCSVGSIPRPDHLETRPVVRERVHGWVSDQGTYALQHRPIAGGDWAAGNRRKLSDSRPRGGNDDASVPPGLYAVKTRMVFSFLCTATPPVRAVPRGPKGINLPVFVK